MLPYLIAFSDSDYRLSVQARFAESIEKLLDRMAIAFGDQLVAIREFDYQEVDAFVSAAHVPQISEATALASVSDRASAFLLVVEGPSLKEPITIVRLGENVAYCLRAFTIRQGPSPSPLSDFGVDTRVSAIRQLTVNEFEQYDHYFIRPTF